MAVYILRRILWMIPTFFVISLVVFVIINLAPGDPGAMIAAQGQETAGQSAVQGEAIRIFREQFNLDKPTLVNTRYTIREEEIARYVSQIARQEYLFAGRIQAQEADILSEARRWFESDKASLAQDASIEECLICDETAPAGAIADAPQSVSEVREYLVFRVYQALALIKSRYPLSEDSVILYEIAKKVRLGVAAEEITRQLRQKSPGYEEIFRYRSDLEKGTFPEKARRLFPEVVFIDGKYYEDLTRGMISGSLREFLGSRNCPLSEEAALREWVISDDRDRKYRVIKNNEDFRVYEVDRKIPDKDLIAADRALEDYGHYAIPHLVNIIATTDNEKIRLVAVSRFVSNARERRQFKYEQYHQLWGRVAHGGKFARSLLQDFDHAHPKIEDTEGKPAYRKQVLGFVNSQFSVYNGELDHLRYGAGAPPHLRKQQLDRIAAWYEKHREWYRYSPVDKAVITLCDTRFAQYWWNLLHFDFGISIETKLPVINTVLSKVRYSICLSLLSVLLAYMIAVPLGIFSAVKQNTLADRSIALVLFMLYSLPSFFVGTLLLQFFSEGGNYWKIFPVSGFTGVDVADYTTFQQLGDILWHLILPVICLTYTGLASLSRYGRTGIIDVIRSDYIKTARAKGLPEYLVILRHAVRNGMIPIITLLGSVLPVLIGGAVVIEFIFAIPGMGSLMLKSIDLRDYNTIMCISLISAVLVMLGILLSDISYALLDPRISFK